MPRAIVVMGVSGAGKSTLARALATALGYRFIEGDDLHLPSSITKMSSGIALEDADRWPWLDRVAEALGSASEAGAVATCSALKRRYRDRLRAGVGPDLVFIHPQMTEDVAADRLAQRKNHFMSPSLVASQYRALEPAEPDERIIAIDATAPTEDQVRHILLGLSSTMD